MTFSASRWPDRFRAVLFLSPRNRRVKRFFERPSFHPRARGFERAGEVLIRWSNGHATFGQ
jgi:hypothetical protein